MLTLAPPLLLLPCLRTAHLLRNTQPSANGAADTPNAAAAAWINVLKLQHWLYYNVPLPRTVEKLLLLLLAGHLRHHPDLRDGPCVPVPSLIRRGHGAAGVVWRGAHAVSICHCKRWGHAARSRLIGTIKQQRHGGGGVLLMAVVCVGGGSERE